MTLADLRYACGRQGCTTQCTTPYPFPAGQSGLAVPSNLPVSHRENPSAFLGRRDAEEQGTNCDTVRKLVPQFTRHVKEYITLVIRVPIATALPNKRQNELKAIVWKERLRKQGNELGTISIQLCSN